MEYRTQQQNEQMMRKYSLIFIRFVNTVYTVF